MPLLLMPRVCVGVNLRMTLTTEGIVFLRSFVRKTDTNHYLNARIYNNLIDGNLSWDELWLVMDTDINPEYSALEGIKLGA